MLSLRRLKAVLIMVTMTAESMEYLLCASDCSKSFHSIGLIIIVVPRGRACYATCSADEETGPKRESNLWMATQRRQNLNPRPFDI